MCSSASVSTPLREGGMIWAIAARCTTASLSSSMPNGGWPSIAV
ncbi:Uncharacterised protein [Mycobacteroides abscessus subsp. abscessus]|nr:Uncharacterised protein [Mycobacteroides abscessus subsp. abscessus]